MKTEGPPQAVQLGGIEWADLPARLELDASHNAPPEPLKKEIDRSLSNSSNS